MTKKDAFDRWWECAEKPLDSPLTIDVRGQPPVEHASRGAAHADEKDVDSQTLVDERRLRLAEGQNSLR